MNHRDAGRVHIWSTPIGFRTIDQPTMRSFATSLKLDPSIQVVDAGVPGLSKTPIVGTERLEKIVAEWLALSASIEDIFMSDGRVSSGDHEIFKSRQHR